MRVKGEAKIHNLQFNCFFHSSIHSFNETSIYRNGNSFSFVANRHLVEKKILMSLISEKNSQPGQNDETRPGLFLCRLDFFHCPFLLFIPGLGVARGTQKGP